MQGYIININRARDEDLIITILTQNQKYTSYRFYGARHSTINLGYKIDFELEHSSKSSIPQLRNVLHLASKWNAMREHMFNWQQYIRLFYSHLKEIEDIESFYFDILETSYQIWDKQNSKRVAIECYVKLLEYEGRLHNDFLCFECDKAITDDVSLLRAFLPAHKSCIYKNSYKLDHVKELFEHKSTLFFNDTDIENLWQVLNEGF
ncbi:MAG: recombination protein RecO [Sulfurospirillaceae bacterium]|nr:recombination protein RecO [Sulfurospirillaceae bacterium]